MVDMQKILECFNRPRSEKVGGGPRPSTGPSTPLALLVRLIGSNAQPSRSEKVLAFVEPGLGNDSVLVEVQPAKELVVMRPPSALRGGCELKMCRGGQVLY